jgi:hypothetical protein
MTQPQFAYTPVSSGQAVAFSEYRYNGQAGLYLIDESLKDYSSAIYLFPDQQIGILLFSNSIAGKILNQLPIKFIERYLTTDTTVAEQAASSSVVSLTAEQLENFAGMYHRIGLPERSFWKTFLIMGTWETLKVTPDESGNLNIRGGVSAYDWNTTWAPLNETNFQFVKSLQETWAFDNFDRDGSISFGNGQNGNVKYLYSGQASYEKLAWYEDASLHILLFGLSLIAFGVFLWQEVVQWLVHWFTIPPYEEKGKLEATRGRYIARILAALSCIIGGGVITIFLALLLTSIKWLEDFTPGQQRSLLYTLMTFPMVYLFIAPGVLIACIFVWKNKYWTFRDRVYYTLATIASSVTVWQFNVWNMIGYKF